MSIGELHWIMNGAIYYFLKCDNFGTEIYTKPTIPMHRER